MKLIRDVSSSLIYVAHLAAILVLGTRRVFKKVLCYAQGGFHDSYHNLSYKNVFGKLWVSTFCEQAEFVVKTDDDMYIDLFASYAVTRC